jgi:hypothetical protein
MVTAGLFSLLVVLFVFLLLGWNIGRAVAAIVVGAWIAVLVTLATNSIVGAFVTTALFGLLTGVLAYTLGGKEFAGSVINAPVTVAITLVAGVLITVVSSRVLVSVGQNSLTFEQIFWLTILYLLAGVPFSLQPTMLQDSPRTIRWVAMLCTSSFVWAGGVWLGLVMGLLPPMNTQEVLMTYLVTQLVLWPPLLLLGALSRKKPSGDELPPAPPATKFSNEWRRGGRG